MTSLIRTKITAVPTAEYDLFMDSAMAAGETVQLARSPDFRNPKSPGAITGPVPASGGSVSYHITLPSPGPAAQKGGLWWMRTVMNGDSNSNALHLWMMESLLSPYTLGGQALRDVLLQNKPAIDERLQAVEPTLGLRRVRYGAEWNMDDVTPGILIKPYAEDEEYENMPYGKYVEMIYDVRCYIRVNDAQNEADAIGQFKDAVVSILNNPAYETYALSDGTIVNGGQSSSHAYDDDFLGTSWASRASFTWKWQLIRYYG